MKRKVKPIDGVTSCMKIREVNKNKKQFISLLLLADEQESIWYICKDIYKFKFVKLENRNLNISKL